MKLIEMKIFLENEDVCRDAACRRYRANAYFVHAILMLNVVILTCFNENLFITHYTNITLY